MKIFKPTNYKDVTVVQFDKTELQKVDLAICEQPTETLEKFYKRQAKKPEVIINGGLFNMKNGVPCFNLYSEYKYAAQASSYTEGMGIIGEAEVKYGTLKTGAGYRDFVSGYPCLIENGKPVKTTVAKELDYAARRSLWGYNDKYIFLVAVEGKGMTFSQCQNLLLALGATYAINLDGGGSTKILHNGKSITSNYYNRAVDNVLCFYLKTPTETPKPTQTTTPKTLYRVQLGAFSKRDNAEKLLAQVKQAGYSDAYIRLINGLYKVQVGAFGVKENAQRLVAELKKKGLVSFITT